MKRQDLERKLWPFTAVEEDLHQFCDQKGLEKVRAEATWWSPHKQMRRLTPRLAKKTISGWKLTDNGYSTRENKTMETLKDEAIDVISKLPDSASIDDIMYQLYVIDKVRKGKEAIKIGDSISTEQLKKEMEEW